MPTKPTRAPKHDAIIAALEAEADRRLRSRYERPVYRRGRVVGYRLACPDALLFARYDALRRELVALRRPQPAPRPGGVFARWREWFAKRPAMKWRSKGAAHAR